MTRQEMYDKVCRHLAKQKKRCATDVGCLYRGPNGMKCAVGALIPNSLYDWKMDEGYYRISELYSVYPAVRKFFGWRNRGFLNRLQELHDSKYNNADNMRRELQDIAKYFKLKAGEEQKIKTWKA